MDNLIRLLCPSLCVTVETVRVPDGTAGAPSSRRAERNNQWLSGSTTAIMFLSLQRLHTASWLTASSLQQAGRGWRYRDYSPSRALRKSSGPCVVACSELELKGECLQRVGPESAVALSRPTILSFTQQMLSGKTRAVDHLMIQPDESFRQP
ncbi:hypothetical protein AOLI_G00101620 [Acnodon oligacanthus]